MGWKTIITVEHPSKYIICLAPHTSNWDFVIGQLFGLAERRTTNFLMKKEWFFWPLGPLFRRLGGIPVYRDKNRSVTDILAQKAREAEDFHLCITPEGTRRLQPEWKRGFYYIALKAELPILLYGLDYKRRLIQCTKQVVPTGDIEREMIEIKQYFEGFQGKHADKFTTGLEKLRE